MDCEWLSLLGNTESSCSHLCSQALQSSTDFSNIHFAHFPWFSYWELYRLCPPVEPSLKCQDHDVASIWFWCLHHFTGIQREQSIWRGKVSMLQKFYILLTCCMLTSRRALGVTALTWVNTDIADFACVYFVYSDGAVYEWDISTGTRVRTLISHSKGINFVYVSA